ncbi:hypothetical protein [Prosthecomicrobium sp. N25]|uniref:hypothetical protein n=1 Tax=Prosthecomicrobium sp. N25 TaxID=3129254 RepID=UPI003076FD72
MFPSTPHGAVRSVFVAFGVALGLWSGAVPTVAARSGISPAELGIGFTLFMAGNLTAMSFAGVLARRFTLRRILLAALPAQGLVLPLLFLAAGRLWFMAALTAMGVLVGIIDLIMNAEGMAVETEKRAPILAGLHGFASGGIAVAAIPSSLAVTLAGPWTIAAAAPLVFGWVALCVTRATPERPLRPADGRSRRLPLTWSLVAIGLVAGISMAGEMAAILWSSSLLAVEAPRLAALAGTGAAFFAGCQSSVRLVADRLRARLGDPLLMNLSILVATAGFGIVALGAGFWTSALGFALIGAGTASIVPCGFALAATTSSLAASTALAVVTLVSSLPRGPMPFVFGAIVERYSFPLAFGLFTGLLAIAFLIALAFQRSRRALS